MRKRSTRSSRKYKKYKNHYKKRGYEPSASLSYSESNESVIGCYEQSNIDSVEFRQTNLCIIQHVINKKKRNHSVSQNIEVTPLIKFLEKNVNKLLNGVVTDNDIGALVGNI